MEIVSANSKYNLIRHLCLLVNEEIKGEFKDLGFKKIDVKRIIENLRRELDDEFLNLNLCSVLSIALNVCDNCNFRRSYCSYSGIYENERVHRDKSMSYETAMKTVNFFFKSIGSNLRFRRFNVFSIGIYGGEPLLEFDLIKRIIEDTERLDIYKNLSNKLKIVFRLTTNGYLLRGKVIDFFKNKDAIIDISLDGSEVEHNKFRIGRNGEKTWATVMENIRTIYRKYPSYYKTRINYLCTIHPLHDEGDIEEFFRSNPGLFDTDKIRFNPVNLRDLKPKVRQEFDKIFGEKGYNPGNLIFLTAVKDSIKGKFKLRDINSQTKFTGACFPGGEKVLIDSEGKFHICEKMNPHFPIGDVHNGFDFKKIRYLMKMYNEEIIRHKCWECDIWFLCPICFTHAVRTKDIKIECDDMKEYYKSIIRKYLDKLEAESEKRDYHPGNAVDYLEQLQ